MLILKDICIFSIFNQCALVGICIGFGIEIYYEEGGLDWAAVKPFLLKTNDKILNN